MPIATFNIPVPPSGDGPAVSIASLVQAKTVVLSGLFRGSYTILANHLGGTFAPVLLFNSDGTEEVRQTLAGAFSEMKVRANAGTVQSSAVTVEVSAIQKVGANMFAPLAALAPGFTGLSPAVDLGGLFPPTGLEDDINVICLGGFEGTITVLGSLDGVGFNPIGTFQASPAQRTFFGQAQVLEFSPLPTSDLVRYIRLDVQGRILSPTTVTIGGAIFNTVVNTDTLAGTYNNGTVPTDQTLALTDAHGGGVVVVGSGLAFTGTNAFSVTAANGGSTNFLRVGGFATESHVTQASAPGLTWNEVDLRSSSIALTGPPVVITALAMVHVGRGTINGLGNTVSDAYDLLVDAAPAGLVTLTRSWSLGTVGPVQVGAGLVLGAGLSPPGESDLVLAPGAANVSQGNSGRLAYVGGATQRFAVSENGGPYELLLTTGSFPTLAEVYSAGAAPVDQTMILADAEGGGVVVDGSGGAFTGANTFSILQAAGNALKFPRLGGIAGAQDRLLSIFVPDEGILDADGKGITITADAGGSGGAGNHNGGDITLAPGAGAGTGLAGTVTALGDFGGVNDIVAGGNLEGANLVLGPLGAINGVLEINFSGVGGTIRTDTGFGDLLELQAFDTLGATYATFITLTSGNPPTCALAGAVTGVTQAPGTSNTTLATTAFVAAAAGTFTQGSVPFGSSTGPLTEDNAELFWDDTNKLLGVGTNGPTARLTVAGAAYVDVAGTRDHVLATATFAPAGGTAAFNQLDLTYTIDQTGGANGRVVGVRIAATETAVGGLHYPIDVFAGAGGVTEIFRLVNDGAVQTKKGLTLGISLAAPGESDLCIEAGATVVSEANTGRLGYLAGGTQQFMVSLNGAAYVPILTGPAAGGFTLGSVPFGSATGTLSQDNANFFWNAANATLQLGGATALASSTLRVLASKSVATIPGAVWDGTVFSPSTLTLTGGPATATALSAVRVGQATINGPGNTATDSYDLFVEAAPAGTATLTRAWSAGFAGAVQMGTGLVLGAALAPPGESDLVFGAGATNVSAAHTARIGYLAAPTEQLMASLNGGAYVPILLGPAAGGFTQGSVPFGSVTGTLAQDNANFFWNAANATLQLGGATALASSTLRVLASKSVATIPGAVWDGTVFSPSTLTLTGGPATATALSAVRVGQATINGPGNTATDSYDLFVEAAPAGTATLTRAWSAGFAGAVQAGAGIVLGTGLAPPGESDLVFGAGATNVSAAHTARIGYLAAPTEQLMASLNGGAYVPILLGPAVSGFTTGSVPFGVASGQLSQDNANFFWDNTNKRLGIGATPTATLHIVEPAVNSATPTAFLLVGGAHTAMVAGTEDVDVNFNLSATKTWATGAIATQRDFIVQARTYAFAAASTASNAATLAVTNAPQQGANATITNAYAFWTQAGATQLDGGNYAQTSATKNHLALTATFAPTSGNANFNTLSLGYTVNQTGGANGFVTGILLNAVETTLIGTHTLLDLQISTTSRFKIGNAGTLALTENTQTGLTAGTEVNGAKFNFAITKTWNTGALITQREMYVQTPTYAFVGASTITNAATVAITGPPIAGTNCTIARGIALLVTGGTIAQSVGTRVLIGNVGTADTTFQPSGSSSCYGLNLAYQADASGTTGTIAGIRVDHVQSSGDGVGTNYLILLRNTNNIFSVREYGATAIFENPIDTLTPAPLLLATSAAHTNITAGVETINVNFNFSATKTWATGAITTQREVVFQAPTYAFNGVSTITTAATVAITNAPQQGANATITNAYALWTQAGATQLDGGSYAPTSGNKNHLGVSATFAPASGNGTFNAAQVTCIVNQTGTATGLATVLKLSAATTAYNTIPFLIQGFNGVAGTTPVFSIDVLGNLILTSNLTLNITTGGADNVRFSGNSGQGIVFAPNNIDALTLTKTNSNVLMGLSTDVASSKFRVQANKTVTSATGAIWNGVEFVSSTLTLSGATTPITTLNFFSIAAPTITAGSAVITTDFFTCRIGAATFTGAGPASATRNWSLGIDGNTKFGGGQTIFARQILVGASPYNVLATDYALEVQSNGGAITLNLPALTGGTVSNGTVYVSIDSGYNAAVANITLVRGNGGDKINNVAASYVQNIPGSVLWLKANVTTNNWELI